MFAFDRCYVAGIFALLIVNLRGDAPAVFRRVADDLSCPERIPFQHEMRTW
jgi:hypothetical protein